MDGTTHLSDYLAILRRRRKQILRVAGAIFAIAVILAVVLPPVYRSTAKLLIEQEVPQDMVPSTVTGYMNQRVQVIRTRVLTPENLARIAQKLDLYAEDRGAPDGARQIAARMRDNIKVEPVSANVTDPRTGAQGMATVALNVSYDAATPEMAQKVAQSVATLFIEENHALRTAKARGASGFLSEEEARLSKQIAELEAKLTAYKEKNQGRLPELMNLNMQMFDRTQRELEEAERQIYTLEQRKVELQSQLALVDPHTGNSPGGRLRELQGEYLAAISRYSPEHPDVIRLKREIASLKQQTGATNERGALETQIKRAQADLAAAQEKYSNDHPDVVRLKKTVSDLEAQLKRAPAGPSGFAMRPDNPAYVTLQTQLDTVDLNLKAMHEQRDRAKQRMGEYEARVVQTPKAEQEGLALQREYEAAVKKYREIKQSSMGANLAVELEKEQRGERYSILEPADLPDQPERPNRRAFILLGLVLGLGAGVGYGSLAEYMDRTVRGPRAVITVLRAPPLATIPYIPNGIDPPARLT